MIDIQRPQVKRLKFGARRLFKVYIVCMVKYKGISSAYLTGVLHTHDLQGASVLDLPGRTTPSRR